MPGLLTEIETATSTTDPDPSRVWLFLVLARLYELRSSSEDPMAEIESVYADFDYPDEIEGFVPFLPAPKGNRRVVMQQRSAGAPTSTSANVSTPPVPRDRTHDLGRDLHLAPPVDDIEAPVGAEPALRIGR